MRRVMKGLKKDEERGRLEGGSSFHQNLASFPFWERRAMILTIISKKSNLGISTQRFWSKKICWEVGKVE